MKRSKTAATDRVLSVLWSAWSELGVAGWRSRVFPRTIDPEALVLWTGCMGDEDARLRDEALDWCIRHSSLISRSRLQRMLKLWPVNEAWGSFAGTLGSQTGQRWPGASKPQRFTASRKSELLVDQRPALAAIRLRCLFGTTARAELLRILLAASPSRRWSISELATEACYTKGNVAEALESLRLGGVLEATTEGNAFRFRLLRRSALENLAGPSTESDASFLWPALIGWRITAHDRELSKASAIVRQVENAKFLAELEPVLARAGLTGLRDNGVDELAALLSAALSTFE
jgi:hypothetical protein